MPFNPFPRLSLLGKKKRGAPVTAHGAPLLLCSLKLNFARSRFRATYRKLSSCSLFAAERLAAASSTPQCTPAPCHLRIPPPSESIYPYESGIAPFLRWAAAPGACHLSAVSGRPPARPATHIPGKAFPGSSCSARRCPEFRRSTTSIPFPASRRTSSPSAAKSLFDSRVPSRRTRPQTSGRPPACKSSCACGRSPFSSNIRDPTSPENSTPLPLCPILKARRPRPRRSIHRFYSAGASDPQFSPSRPLLLHRRAFRLTLTPTSTRHTIISTSRHLKRASRSVVHGPFL